MNLTLIKFMKKYVFVSLIFLLITACSMEPAKKADIKLGLQSWTCRNMTF